MKRKQAGWRAQRWRNCQDIHIAGVIEGVPRYLRCMRCYRLVTHGQVEQGGCICGFRKLNPCLALTLAEIALLKLGWFPLRDFEHDAIGPLCPWLGAVVRPRVFRLA